MSLLAVRDVDAFYGDFQALFGVSLEVAEGETVAIIGANGAGKSTFLGAVAGVLPVDRDAVRLDGVPVGGLRADRMVDLGVALVPEGRRIFPSLTVEENLLVGAHRARAGASRARTCPAESSRCSPLAAASWATRVCSWSTRCRWASPRWW